MKKLLLAFLMISTILMSSCNSTKKVLTDFGWDKDCPFHRLNFSQTEESYDINKTISITDSLLAGATADVESLSAKGKIKNALNFKIENIIKKEGKGKINVPSDWWQEYTVISNKICTLRDALKNNLIKSKAGRIKAENLYLEMLSSFENMKSTAIKKKMIK